MVPQQGISPSLAPHSHRAFVGLHPFAAVHRSKVLSQSACAQEEQRMATEDPGAWVRKATEDPGAWVCKPLGFGLSVCMRHGPLMLAAWAEQLSTYHMRAAWATYGYGPGGWKEVRQVHSPPYDKAHEASCHRLLLQPSQPATGAGGPQQRASAPLRPASLLPSACASLCVGASKLA